MSEAQETGTSRKLKPNRFTTTNVVIAMALMIVMISTSFLPLINSSDTIIGNRQAAHVATGPILTGTAQTNYAYENDFSTPLDSGWAIYGAGLTDPNGFHIINGELQILAGWTASGSYGQHYFNLSKQDFNVSFNFRIASNASTAGTVEVFHLTAQASNSLALDDYAWGIDLLLEANYTVKIKHDNGSKEMVPGYSYSYSSALAKNINYQFWMEFDRNSDVVSIRILNKTSQTFLLDAEYVTWSSSIKSNLPIPNRFEIGALAYAGCNLFYDNLTISYTQAIHGAVSISTTALEAAISAFATKLIQSEHSANHWWLATQLDSGAPWGELYPYVPGGSRDDVAGEMISSLVSLYQYYDDPQYLAEAERIWSVLQTHQQADKGFTFASNNTDYSDTMGRIMLGLTSLYEATGNSTYLDYALEMVPTLSLYQVTATPGAGQVSAGSVYGPHTRGGSYGLQNMVWFTGYFAIAMLEVYKFTGNATAYQRSLMALSFLLNMTTYSGYVWNSGWGFGHTPGNPNDQYQDYNDVSNAGMALWALSEGYKVTHTTAYLTAAQKIAGYLVRSEFTKDGKCWGAWAGVVKERYNQVDILYNYPIEFGLKSYLDIYPGDTSVRSAYYASINFLISIQGMTGSAQGIPLAGTTGLWGSAINFNDSSSPKWTTGWWDEGEWGTWGLIGFFGWQSNVIKTLTSYRSANGQDPYAIFLNSTVFGNPTSRYSGVFSSSMQATGLNFSSSTDCTVFVDYYSASRIHWIARADMGTITVTFTLSGLESGRMYRLYIDGVSSSLLTASGSGVVSFTYSGPWSEHQFEIVATSIGGSISGLVNLIFIMFAIGIVVGVVGANVRALRKEENPKVETLINMAIYIIIGLAGLSALYGIIT